MKHTITTTADSYKIEFEGELIAEADSSVQITDWDEREFLLNLYAIVGGGFVVVIELNSSNAGIADVVEAERVDSVSNAEAAFLVFEPMAYIKTRSLLFRDSKQSEKQVAKWVDDAYESAMHAILEKLREYKSEHPDCDLVSPKKPKGQSRLLGF